MEKILSDIADVESRNLKISFKVWDRCKKISRYLDDNDNTVRYQVDEGDLITDYFLEEGFILIRTRKKDEEALQEEWWVQNGNDIVSVNSETEKLLTIMTVQQVDFLYQKLLDEQEKDDVSNVVTLGKEIAFSDFDDYKEYLTFQNEEFIRSCYTYEADESNITLEDALDLCAAVVTDQFPDLQIERVMDEEDEGYVGYKLSSREIGVAENKQIIENRIGTLNESAFDGMAYHLYMYEYVIDEVTGKSHTAITIDYHIFLRDKLLVLE